MICFFFRLLALLTILSHTGFSAPYHRPDGSKELFQLENIPLRVITMKEISKHLVVIACRKQDDRAEQRRASAQLLALAMRLDPTNRKIRETDKTFSEGKKPNEAKNDQVVQAKSTLRFYHKWLASPDAGKDANLLASLLSDATKTLDQQTRNQPDTADWSEVLPAIQAPPRPKPPSGSQPKKTEKNITELPKPAPQPAVLGAQFHLPQLLVHAPLTIEIKKKYTRPRVPTETYYRYIAKNSITPIEIEISKSATAKDKLNQENTPKDTNTLTFKFSPRLVEENRNPTTVPALLETPQKPTTSQKITYTLKTLLQSRHSTLPASNVSIKLSQGRYALSNYLAITAPLAIMLEASATNQPLRNDIHICAAINAQGELRQPNNFWEQFQLLRKSERGGRLIVAAESNDLMMQSLVFGHPEFFTRWEIFTAETLDQAMELAPKTNPKNITDASELFRTIQELTQKSKVTQIAVNSAVRNRLSEIMRLAPNHLSSKALLIQGSPNRPSRLNDLALAHELFPIIQRIDKHLSSRTAAYIPSTDQLKKIHTELRESLDPLEPLVDGTDDKLYQQTMKLTNDFRRLEILVRRSKNISDDGIITISQSSRNLILSMRNESKNLKGQIEKTLKAK
jgi:hypothetical protein